MRERTAVILCLILVFAGSGSAVSSDEGVISTDVVTISLEKQHEIVEPNKVSTLAVHFELKKDWHFYASAESAPGGMNLKLAPSAEKNFISFSNPIFPKPHLYFDKSLSEKLEVFSDKFTVFVPFHISELDLVNGKPINVVVKIGIEGAVCSDVQCRVPDFGALSIEVKIADTPMGEAKFVLPEATGQSKSVTQGGQASYSLWFALGLAFLAGLSLNIMPCVWPMLPLIVMRLIEQAKQDRGKSIAMGLAFCLGILLFFATFAGANIILKSFYNTSLSWGDHLRNPTIAIGLSLLMIVLALFMFGVFTITIPSSIANKSGSGKGYVGSIVMGFLAAILSTPCSFGILAVAFVWVQGQHLALGTVAIMIIGIGMAAPYAILTLMPGLLSRLPAAGRWMELFKQTLGFILLLVAVKLIKGIPDDNKINVLYFAVVLSFCLWMWFNWVSYGSKLSRKILVRASATILVILSFRFFFAPQLINWQNYDMDLIEKSISEDRPVLIKFTAGWCTNCEVVDRLVYQRKDIAKLIKEKGVLTIKADTTTKDLPATLALKNIYNELGVPVSVLYIPGEKEPVRWRGISFANELKPLLEKLP